MKTFKIIDTYMSIVLIGISIIIGITNYQVDWFIASYFAVGGWQVISMIVHEVSKTFVHPKSTRRLYHYIVLVVISTILLGLVLDNTVLMLLYILLFVAPFMAIFYTIICYNETFNKMKRPLAALK
jgi:undecaprenyl pyrophosphate phosphatase UppP